MRKFRAFNITYKLKNFLKPTRRRFFSIMLFVFGLFVIPFVLVNVLLIYDYQDQIYAEENFGNLTDTRVLIVFGAGLNTTAERPSLLLRDRLDTAVKLYETGKAQKILVSGDNRFEDYNEPQVMYNYLLSKGVKDFDLTADFAGRTTYETCFRAKEIFGINEAILVTQKFHLTRALYTCEVLGIDSQGAIADSHEYESIRRNQLRELFAIPNTFYKLHINPPLVVLGEKIAI